MQLNAIQIILLSCFVAFMAVETYWWGGCMYIARPIVGGPLVGLLLGDFQTGLVCGGMIEMVFLGGMSMGAYAPPNSYIGGMVGTALAILSGGNIELGVALAYPIGLIVQQLNYVVTNLNQIWVVRMEKCAEEANERGITFYTLMCIFTRAFIQYFLPTAIGLFAGSEVISTFYENLPQWITRGLSVAAGLLPAIGLASIVNTLGIKKGWPYFVIGFVLSTYLKMNTMSIALIGLALAMIIYQITTKDEGLGLQFDESKAHKGVLDDSILRKIFFRSFASMGGFNYKSYNAPGFLYSEIPGLKKIYEGEEEKYREALVRNTEFHNTHPFFKNLIIGVALAMEEENANDDNFDVKMISSTKAALMGPLAGIGDSVFQGVFRVLFSAIGAGLAINGNVAGPVIYTIANFCLAWGTRWYFLKYGYKYGVELVARLKSSDLFQKFVDGATIVGMMVMAAMVSTTVSLKLKPEWVYVQATETAAAKSFTLQSIFDGILPNLVPLLVTFIMYKIMKKYKNGIYYCLFGSFIIAFIGVIIGLF